MASTSRVVMSPRIKSILAAGVFTSRRKPLDQPIPVGLSRVTESIVQTIWPALPEFDCFRFDPISAPVWPQRNGLLSKAFCQLRYPRAPYAPSIEHLSLT